MIILTVTENEGNRRLDRFLKKYFGEASLSHIYKLIRKDVKVNGKRVKEDCFLVPGDQISIYISEEEAQKLRRGKTSVKVRKQFKIAYEDHNFLVADKPFGLLTHGDGKEKKNHLTNQVISYLIESGEYNPGTERTFVPSPINRLDRNTTGLVLFGKNGVALREGSRLVREKSAKAEIAKVEAGSAGSDGSGGAGVGLRKLYLTIVAGNLTEKVTLRDFAAKKNDMNMMRLSSEDAEDAKEMLTIALPIAHGSYRGMDFTLVEAEIITGRTHQIRFQLAAYGHPLIGDAKYGSQKVNRLVKDGFGLSTQLLHSCRLEFPEMDGSLSYLSGKAVEAAPPPNFARIRDAVFGQSSGAGIEID